MGGKQNPSYKLGGCSLSGRTGGIVVGSEDGDEQRNVKPFCGWIFSRKATMAINTISALYLEFCCRKAFCGLNLQFLLFSEHLSSFNDFHSVLKNQHHQFVDHPEGLRQRITLSFRILQEEIFLLFLLPVLFRWWRNLQVMLPGIHSHGSALQMQNTPQVQESQQMQENEESCDICFDEVMKGEERVISELGEVGGLLSA